MIGFTGSPKIEWNGTTIELPRPVKGGRIEEYDDSDTKEFRNLLGQLVKGRKKEVFKGEYRFTDVDSNIIEGLTILYNQTDIINFYPYSDLNFAYLCYWKLQKPRNTGYVQIEDITIKVKSKNYIKKRIAASLDNIFSCFMSTNSYGFK